MKLEHIRETMDERGVSPVIGVILMVAITVILAAVIGTFVLGLGGQVSQSAPQASMEFSSGATVENVTISHDGGETLVAQDVAVVVRNDSVSARFDLSSAGKMSVGERAELNVSTGDYKWGNSTGNASAASFQLYDGNKYEVIVIDKDSQQQIASATITARP